MIPYNKKYNYTTLTRTTEDNGKRTYNTPHGDKVPSVTTILGATKDMTAIVNWRKRIGASEANYITTLSANVGTLIHTHLECYIKDEKRPQGNSIPRKAARKLSQIVIEKGLCNVSEVWGLECPLFYPKLYAGTTDVVGLHKNIPAIIDFKNTRKPKKLEWVEDYFLQLAGYIEAHNKVYDTNIKKGVIMMVSREESHFGEYQEFIIEGNDYTKYCDMWWRRVEEYYVSMGKI